MRNRADYKKLYFEEALNNSPKKTSVYGIIRRLRMLGYHYEVDGGMYYVYSPHEWEIKRRFEKTVSPALRKIFGGIDVRDD